MSDQNNHRPQPIPTTLAGYVRRSGALIKVSISVDAFNDCVSYTSGDGIEFVALDIDLKRLHAIINGERNLTTIIQRGSVAEHIDRHYEKVRSRDSVEKENRIQQLERQAKDDYLNDIEWNFVLEMLDDEEYAELKNLYLEMDNSMHMTMDNRGQNE